MSTARRRGRQRQAAAPLAPGQLLGRSVPDHDNFQKAEVDAQVKIITAEAGIKVAQHEARQVEERARGDAAQVRMIAEAEATAVPAAAPPSAS